MYCLSVGWRGLETVLQEKYFHQPAASCRVFECSDAKDSILCQATAAWWLRPHNFVCVLQIVGKGLQDGHAKVRGAAAFALGQLAEHCQPEINEHGRQALPLIFGVVRDSDSDVQEQAFYALVAFCETLGELCPLQVAMAFDGIFCLLQAHHRAYAVWAPALQKSCCLWEPEYSSKMNV